MRWRRGRPRNELANFTFHLPLLLWRRGLRRGGRFQHRQGGGSLGGRARAVAPPPFLHPCTYNLLMHVHRKVACGSKGPGGEVMAAKRPKFAPVLTPAAGRDGR